MWFKKQEAKIEVVPPKSTIAGLELPRESIFKLGTAIEKSLQRSPADFRAIDQSGAQMAMDWNDSDYSTKMLADYNDIMNPQLLGWYAGWGFIGWQTAAILAQHWLIDKACTMPARDALRHGYELAVGDGQEVDEKIFDYIKKQDKKFKLKKNLLEYVKMGRVFGMRVALFQVDSPDPTYYEKPFNIDGVRAGSYKGITQIDPYWVAPELDHASASDPKSQHFYEPTWWRINGKRYHRSHLCIFRNGDVPDILKPSYLYGGIPVPQKIASRVYAAERTADEAPMLSLSKRTTVVKLDVEKAVANQSEFENMMNFWTTTRDNYGVKVVGLDDDLQQFDTSLSEFDSVIMTQYQLVASAANVPATKLLGTSPKGFDSAGQQEQDSYHEELETIQSNDMEDMIERHHLLLMRSHVLPKFGIEFQIEVNWNPVDSPSAKEQAEINKIKADTGAVLVNAGAIDGQDERDRIIKDKDSGYNGIEALAPEPEIEQDEFDEEKDFSQK